MADKAKRKSHTQNIQNPIKDFHRAAMLDLILTWGTLDGALSMLAARILGLQMHEAADEIGKLRGSAKIAKMIKVFSEVEEGKTVAKILKKHKKAYEKHSVPRNRIAHAHCVGYSAIDDDYILFAVFERVGEDGLAVDAVPVEEMQRATSWGRNLTKIALRIVDDTELK